MVRHVDDSLLGARDKLDLVLHGEHGRVLAILLDLAGGVDDGGEDLTRKAFIAVLAAELELDALAAGAEVGQARHLS